MLTRFVRTQLIIFTIASIIGIGVMVINYLQAPTLLGIGRMTVKLELPRTGGLYQFSNVTYRGVQIGKVTDVAAHQVRSEATMSLDTSPKVPADLQAGPQRVGGRRAVRGPGAANRLRALPGQRFGDPAKNTTVPQRSARCSIRSTRC